MNYRIPKLEEFIQGFEFEYCQRKGGQSWFVTDLNITKEDVIKQLKTNEQPTYDNWIPMKVFWLNEDWIHDGNFTYKLNAIVDCPIDLKWALENNKLRVKIKKNGE